MSSLGELGTDTQSFVASFLEVGMKNWLEFLNPLIKFILLSMKLNLEFSAFCISSLILGSMLLKRSFSLYRSVD